MQPSLSYPSDLSDPLRELIRLERAGLLGHDPAGHDDSCYGARPSGEASLGS